MFPRPFLTIGIASYNYARFLPAALEHIRRQNFADFEVLYCDDGSADGSPERIRALAARNPTLNIRLIAAENKGLLANKNRILENARGEYLLLCDADDYMLDGCLAALCGAARRTGADCVIGGFCEVDGAGHRLKVHVPPPHASKWLYPWHHAQMYRLDLVRRNALRFDRLPDDACFLQQVHLHSQRTVFVPQVLYAWVRHGDSTSRDIAGNRDWMPEKIWCSLARFVASLRSQNAAVLTREDETALNYFLYKWYYFNAADLCLLPRCARGAARRAMQREMHAVFPQSARPTALLTALTVGDTAFARCAVAGCWMLERLGLLPVIDTLRGVQQTMRKAAQNNNRAECNE